MLRQLLEQYREQEYNRDKGDAFERLICAYLKADPQYQNLFSGVWLWKDWPQRKEQGYSLPDTGIDLVQSSGKAKATAPSSASFMIPRLP